MAGEGRWLRPVNPVKAPGPAGLSAGRRRRFGSVRSRFGVRSLKPLSIIVTGAAGRLGRLVTEQLLQRLAPEELVLVTRRPDALRDLRARGVDVRQGDFDDAASLPRAFAGAERMLLISTDALGRRL